MDRRIDGLRILACFMVILLHVSAVKFQEFGEGWWSANFWDSLTRACVPIFFMLSGALLLNKSEPLKDFLWKRATKIAIPLVVWSCFYLWWLQYNGVDTGNWLIAIAKGPVMYHLWYFYAILGLYLFIPVLRRFYQSSSSAEKIYFLVIWFTVSSLLPTVHSLVTNPGCGYLNFPALSNVYNLQYFGGYVGYFFLGAFLCDKKHNCTLGVTLFAVGVLGTAIATHFISMAVGGPCEFFFIYLSPFVVLAAVGLFIAFLGLAEGVPSRTTAWISGCTLGIYGLHAFVLDYYFMRNGLLELTGIHWVDPLIAAMGVFLVCLVVVSGLRVVPSFRRIF